MNNSVRDVTTVVISTDIVSLVVPAASVAEVLPRMSVQHIPATQPWCLGFVVWRGLPVSVVSFESLVGGGTPIIEPSRLVVFYPLNGRSKQEFFALATNHEPRSMQVDAETASAPMPYGVSPQYVAGALRYGQQIVVIPNFEAMRRAFYGQ